MFRLKSSGKLEKTTCYKGCSDPLAFWLSVCYMWCHNHDEFKTSCFGKLRFHDNLWGLGVYKFQFPSRIVRTVICRHQVYILPLDLIPRVFIGIELQQLHASSPTQCRVLVRCVLETLVSSYMEINLVAMATPPSVSQGCYSALPLDPFWAERGSVDVTWLWNGGGGPNQWETI